MLNLKLDLAPLNQNLHFNEIPSDVYTKWVWETFSNTVSEMSGKSQSVLEGPSCRAERPKWAQVRAVVLSGSSPTRSCRTNTMDSLPQRCGVGQSCPALRRHHRLGALTREAAATAKLSHCHTSWHACAFGKKEMGHLGILLSNTKGTNPWHTQY